MVFGITIVGTPHIMLFAWFFPPNIKYNSFKGSSRHNLEFLNPGLDKTILAIVRYYGGN